MSFYVIRLKFLWFQYGYMLAWNYGSYFQTTTVDVRYPTTFRENLKLARELRNQLVTKLFEVEGIKFSSRHKPAGLLGLVEN